MKLFRIGVCSSPSSLSRKRFAVPGKLVVAVCALVLAVGTALADNREEAGREFEAGQAAEKSKDYAGAIEHYLRSYQLAPHPDTAYNLAFNYERVAKFRDAATYYKTYLDTSENPPDAAKVRKTIADLTGRVSRVVIRSSPPGAQITIDDRPAGVEPVVVNLPGGPHRVVATLGGQQVVQDITPAFGEPADVQLAILPQTGSLSVWSTVVGTQVWVDGKLVGNAPLGVSLIPGPHRITAAAPGWAPQSQTVQIVPGRGSEIRFALQRGGAQPGGPGPVSPPIQNKAVSWMAAIGAGSVVARSDNSDTGFSGDLRFGVRTRTLQAYGSVVFGETDGFGIGVGFGQFSKPGARFIASLNSVFAGSAQRFDGRIGLSLQVSRSRSLAIDVSVEGGFGISSSRSAETVGAGFVPVLAYMTFYQ